LRGAELLRWQDLPCSPVTLPAGTPAPTQSGRQPASLTRLRPHGHIASMRRFLEPRLVNGEFGDPTLYVDVRDERRALLFDLGDITALPPRKLLRVAQVFVSHTHMDHFAGFDTMLRLILGRKPRVELFGGPGFVDQVEHKLRAYTWNVVHRYEVELVLHVHAIGTDGRVERARFASRTAFAREDLPATRLQGDVLYETLLFRVRGRFVDHEMPCLAFAVEEKAHVKVAKDRLDALGVSTGPWLRELKLAVLAGAPATTPIHMHWVDRDGAHDAVRSVGELIDVVLDVSPGQRIGYVTDLRFTDANRRTLRELLAGVDQLFIESVFLEADAGHAERKNHLTARQAGLIAREVAARIVVPFHFSPRYEGRPEALREELHAAWAGDRR
jgi:ribonuclease Z